MSEAVVFDSEFLTAPGAPQRFWCGPHDPDPIVVQIGAVRLDQSPPWSCRAEFERLVIPAGRHGERVALHPPFERLTGVTEAQVTQRGVRLEQALNEFAAFAGSAPLWSWGKDEFHLMAISCYVAGIAPVLPAHRFGNAVHLLRAAGVPDEEVTLLRSDTLTAHFGLPSPERPGHDALGDAQSVALTLRHFLQSGALPPDRLRDPMAAWA